MRAATSARGVWLWILGSTLALVALVVAVFDRSLRPASDAGAATVVASDPPQAGPAVSDLAETNTPAVQRSAVVRGESTAAELAPASLDDRAPKVESSFVRRVGGFVLDRHSQRPLVGARVSLHLSALVDRNRARRESSSSKAVESGVTSGSGRFLLDLGSADTSDASLQISFDGYATGVFALLAPPHANSRDGAHEPVPFELGPFELGPCLVRTVDVQDCNREPRSATVYTRSAAAVESGAAGWVYAGETGARGRIRLALSAEDAVEVVALSPLGFGRRSLLVVDAGEAARPIPLPLEEPIGLRVQVRASGGEALEGAVVVLADSSGWAPILDELRRAPRPLDTSLCTWVTDAQGVAHLAPVARPGSRQSLRLVVTADGYRERSKRIAGKRLSGEELVEIRLSRPASLTEYPFALEVVDSSGAPVATAHVELSGQRFPCDADGRVALRVEQASMFARLHVSAPGFMPRSAKFDLREAGGRCVLSRYERLSGHVRDTLGRRLSSMRVELFKGKRVVDATWTNQQGEFGFDQLAPTIFSSGRARVVVRPAQPDLWIVPLERLVRAGESDVRLELQRLPVPDGRLQLRVVSALSGAALWPQAVKIWPADLEAQRPAPTRIARATGEVAVSRVHAGSWLAEVATAEGRCFHPFEIPAAGGLVEGELRAGPPGTLVGKLTERWVEASRPYAVRVTLSLFERETSDDTRGGAWPTRPRVVGPGRSPDYAEAVATVGLGGHFQAGELARAPYWVQFWSDQRLLTSRRVLLDAERVDLIVD